MLIGATQVIAQDPCVMPGSEPFITTLPYNANICTEGSSVMVYLPYYTMYNQFIPDYQWYKDGTPIPGATEPAYFATEAGLYKVKVRIQDPVCHGYSNEIEVTGNGAQGITAPLIERLPQNGLLCSGDGTVILRLANEEEYVNGERFQWLKDNLPIDGSTKKIIVVEATGAYRLAVLSSGETCHAFSEEEIIAPSVTQIDKPTLAATPNQTVLCGENGIIQLSVSNTGSFPNGYYYWFKGDAIAQEGYGSTFVVKEAGDYFAHVTVGTYASTSETKTFTQNTTAIAEPDVRVISGDQNICDDNGSYSEVVLELYNTGDYSSPGYQWFKNNEEISGATGTTYTVTEADSYYLRIIDGSCATVSETFEISVVPKAKIILSNKTTTYTGEPQYIDSVFLQANGNDAGEKSWIIYAYEDENGKPVTEPIDVGTYHVTANFAGNNDYCSATEATATLSIEEKDISSNDIAIAAIADQIYTGNAFTPLPVVSDGASALIKDTDYTLSYVNNVNVGTATITIMGMGIYSGSRNVTFKIAAKDIAHATITASLSPNQYDYTGSAITPLPVVKDGATDLVKDTDYTLSYANNVNAGAATITIPGKGNYSRVRTLNFVINKKEAVAPPSLPEGLEATYGNRFRDVSLPDGFSWPNPGSTVGNASSFPVTVTAIYNPDPAKYEDYIVLLQLMIYPATPPGEVIFPEAKITTAIVYDPQQTLSNIALINGSGYGVFFWRYPNTVPTVNQTGYEVVFTPNDTNNYDYSGVEGWNERTRTITRTITLTIIPRDIAIDLVCDRTKTYTGLPVELCEAEIRVSELRSSTTENIALEYLYYRNGLIQDETINAGVYEVIARSADTNYSGQSASVTFTIEKAQPVISVNDTLAVYTGEAIAVAYEITGSYTAPGLSRTVTFTYEGINDTSYGPTQTSPTEIGEYKVHAYTPGSVNHLSAEAEAVLKIVGGVGINQVELETFKLYPNPVSKNSKLIIDNGQWTVDNERTFVEVYDTNGTLLRKIPVTDNKIELRSENTEGIYLYVIRSDTGVMQTVKVVVK